MDYLPKAKFVLDKYHMNKYATKATAHMQEYAGRIWEGIKVQEEDAKRIVGCSAEGHNSHILAFRMSSYPMGWSKDGADKMARLRAFKANEGKVIDFLRAQSKEDKMYSITKKLMRSTHQGLKSKINEKPCNFAVFRIGKVTGLYKALKAI